jgi:hypothetical protein
VAASGEKEFFFCYVQSRNVVKNKRSMKGITQNVYQNKSLIKKCQNVTENEIDSMVYDPRS